jgi:hypothetical protein
MREFAATMEEKLYIWGFCYWKNSCQVCVENSENIRKNCNFPRISDTQARNSWQHYRNIPTWSFNEIGVCDSVSCWSFFGCQNVVYWLFSSVIKHHHTPECICSVYSAPVSSGTGWSSKEQVFSENRRQLMTCHQQVLMDGKFMSCWYHFQLRRFRGTME